MAVVANSYYSFKPRNEGLERRARDAAGRWTSAQAVVERVNKQAIATLSEWAVVELDKHIRREEGPDGRTGKLEEAILNPESHVANKDGFQFLVADKVAQQAIYWRAIEHGSGHMLGRRMRLLFVSGGSWIAPDPARGGSGVGPGARGGLDSAFIAGGKGLGITIHRPIVGYHYAKTAVDRFVANDNEWYRNAIDKELSSVGLQLARRR